MSVENLSFNKKRTKVKITGKPKYYNLIGTAIQWIPPIAYLAVKFDLFTFDNQGYAITGWGIVGAIMVFLAMRSKIKETLAKYETSIGPTWKRIKTASVLLTITGVLGLTYLLFFSFFILFGILTLSSAGSIFFYAPYDTLDTQRMEMQKMLDEENKTANFNKLKSNFDQLNA